MTWISDSQFISAVSNEGAFGCLAAGNMEPSLLDEEIKKTQELTKNPFAVNLITIAPFYREHLKVAINNRVPFIVFAGSYPRHPEIRMAKESGAKVLSFASTEALQSALSIQESTLSSSKEAKQVGMWGMCPWASSSSRFSLRSTRFLLQRLILNPITYARLR